MQPPITKEDIQYAEKILLPEGELFDDERINFIKNLNTIDLQACPGSGKTTCLLAKLLILAKHRTFVDGVGILVLSHTNAAIDEIKEKIYKHCPELFTYPNYIGTIQGFVDNFLAIPFYIQTYGHSPYRIDDDIFNERIKKVVSLPQNTGLSNWLARRPNIQYKILKDSFFDLNGNLVIPMNSPPKVGTSVHDSLSRIRLGLLKEGSLQFKDAFYLAELYITKYPNIINLIQKRFAFVFIDEMQDTDVDQMRIINLLFSTLRPGTVLQRLGDQNQAIYQQDFKSEAVWVLKEEFLSLTGSKRLSIPIANAIKNIALFPQDLTGNSKRQKIKPKILIFDDSTVTRVLSKFGEIIVKENLHLNKKNIFKAIGWRKEIKEEDGEEESGKLCLKSYFDFDNSKQKSRADYALFSDYFFISNDLISEKGVAIVKDRFLKALVKALRLSEVKNSEGVYFNPASVLAFIKINNKEEYDKLMSNLYAWAKAFFSNEDIYLELRAYVIHLLTKVFIVQKASDALKQFMVTSTTQSEDKQTERSKSSNSFIYDSEGTFIDIQVNSVHGVKGETHTGTLYLETYYYNDGGKSYESQRLIKQIKGVRVGGSLGKRVQESLKVAYVGLSRPTDLLCFAIHSSRLSDQDILELKNNWEIIKV